MEKQSEILILDDHKNAKRILNQELKIISDTFKLMPAVMQKNISFNPHSPQLQAMEHCHIFHTYDSGGKKLGFTNQVGGHYHSVEVSTDSKGNFKVKVSPPIQNPKSEKIYANDTHTHEVQYIKSEEIAVRKQNPEAIKIYNQVTSGKM